MLRGMSVSVFDMQKLTIRMDEAVRLRLNALNRGKGHSAIAETVRQLINDAYDLEFNLKKNRLTWLRQLNKIRESNGLARKSA